MIVRHGGLVHSVVCQYNRHLAQHSFRTSSSHRILCMRLAKSRAESALCSRSARRTTPSTRTRSPPTWPGASATTPGAERRLRAAALLADPRTNEATAALRLIALRMHADIGLSSVPSEPAVATLIQAHEAWALGETTTASRLLDQSRNEGIDTTSFSEEAALLAADLGAPPRTFKPDPPYPVQLRFVAIWELRRK